MKSRHLAPTSGTTSFAMQVTPHLRQEAVRRYPYPRLHLVLQAHNLAPYTVERKNNTPACVHASSDSRLSFNSIRRTSILSRCAITVRLKHEKAKTQQPD
jgi:hypothetical protein